MKAYLAFLERSKNNIYQAFDEARREGGKIGPIRKKDGSVTHDDKEKADIFNDHFQSIINKQGKRSCDTTNALILPRQNIIQE